MISEHEHNKLKDTEHLKEDFTKNSRSPIKVKQIAFFVGVIVILVAAGLIPRLLQRKALAEETREMAVPKVSVVEPMSEKNETELMLPAEVKPWIEVPIYARATGYLKRWLVDIGTKVKAGQLLAVIETPELDQELDQARHQLKETEAQLSLAKITAARYAELVKTASVSEQDNAEKQSDLELKTAAVSAERANVRRLEYMQSFSRVTAPFAGTITLRECDTGELIAASGKELFRLSQTNKLRVYVRVPQANALGVKPGQIEKLIIPELPGIQFPAKVVRTADEISSDSRTLLTELEVNNSGSKILAGSFGQVKFVNIENNTTLTLPSNSIMFGEEGPYVALVNQNSKIELRNIKLGRNFGMTIEILSGIGKNDRIVLNPSETFANGTKVNVVKAEMNKMEKQNEM